MARALMPGELFGRLRRDLDRSVLRARNGLRHLSDVGRLEPGQSPKDVVWSSGRAELWRYRSDRRRLRPPLLLVHSLISRSYVFDLAPGSSFVEAMLDRGFDVFLTNWGETDELDAENALETYCDGYLPEMVEVAMRLTGARDVNIFGYCLGGVLALLYAAGHSDTPVVRSLAVMATPVAFSQLGPMATLLQEGRVDPGDLVDHTGNVPADIVYGAFRLLKPTSEMTAYADLWQNLWNDDYLEAHQGLRQWARDHVPFPGACFAQVGDLFVRNDLLAAGRVPLGGRTVDLADVTVPFLNIVGDKDHIIPVAASRDLTRLVGSADVEELCLPAGHVGLVVGGAAQERNIPAMAAWLERNSEAAPGGDQPTPRPRPT
jgi:polyhydroxyalkanoate synthase